MAFGAAKVGFSAILWGGLSVILYFVRPDSCAVLFFLYLCVLFVFAGICPGWLAFPYVWTIREPCLCRSPHFVLSVDDVATCLHVYYDLLAVL